MKGKKIGDVYDGVKDVKLGWRQFRDGHKTYGEGFEDPRVMDKFAQDRIYTQRGEEKRIPREGQLTPYERGILCSYGMGKLRLYSLQGRLGLIGNRVDDALEALSQTGNLHTSTYVAREINELFKSLSAKGNTEGFETFRNAVGKRVDEHKKTQGQ